MIWVQPMRHVLNLNLREYDAQVAKDLKSAIKKLDKLIRKTPTVRRHCF